MIRIECYMSLGCGSEEALRRNVKTAVTLEGIDAAISFRRISDGEAFALGLKGSPAVHINGQDIDPQELSGFS